MLDSQVREDLSNNLRDVSKSIISGNYSLLFVLAFEYVKRHVCLCQFCRTHVLHRAS